MKIIFVDDSKIAHAKFKKEASLIKSISTVSLFTNAEEALHYCKTEKPDLAIIDIEMPGKDGIWLGTELAKLGIPFSFLTSHNNYATEAFSLSATHYILKPINAEVLMEIISKYSQQKASQNYPELIKQLTSLVVKKTNEIDRIFLHNLSKTIVLDTDSILYLSAAGSYTIITNTSGIAHTSTKTLKYFEDVLKGNLSFVRIHRANLVNKKYVKMVLKKKHKIYLKMFNDSELEVSPVYRDQIYNMLNL